MHKDKRYRRFIRVAQPEVCWCGGTPHTITRTDKEYPGLYESIVECPKCGQRKQAISNDDESARDTALLLWAVINAVVSQAIAESEAVYV